MTCFQLHCPTIFNLTLSQVFLPPKYFLSYRESRIFASGHYRVCPSVSCSKLLIMIPNRRTSSLMCTCGQRICAECFDELHFPITCYQYKIYLQRLMNSGDHILRARNHLHQRLAEGTDCPICVKFIDLTGLKWSINPITCSCGYCICTHCLKEWSETHKLYFCAMGRLSIREVPTLTGHRLHSMAVRYRRQRNISSVDQLTRAIQRSEACIPYSSIILATYIDLFTLAEFIYVLFHGQSIQENIRDILRAMAWRLVGDAYRIQLQVDLKQINPKRIEMTRTQFSRTLDELAHMKRNKMIL